MRKYITILLIALSLFVGNRASAQYNKEYFFWVGRHFLVENNYPEAIKTLNILLRVDEEV